jgi:hypothetical protein
MKLHDVSFKGFFEEEPKTAEMLQLVEPENELEEAQVAWAILPHPETVSDDSARRDYVFHYDVGKHLGRGLYELSLHARDASGGEWRAEIAGGLIASATPATTRPYGFAPFWFISRDFHFKAGQEEIERNYPGEAFGRLDFGRVEALPHRRLFGLSAGPAT